MNVFELEASLNFDTKEFKKSIKEAKKEIEELGKSFDSGNKETNEFQKELEELSDAVKEVAREDKKTSDETNELKKALEKLVEATKETSREEKKGAEQVEDYGEAVEDTAGKVGKLKTALERLKELPSVIEDKFKKLASTIKEMSVSSISKGFESLKNLSSEVADKMGQAVTKIKDGFVKVAQVGAASIGAATAAVTAFTKSALDNYSNYEQYVGGVETLFGESSQRLIDNADKAYKTAGMSVNEYMNTSIQGAAAMISALGGDQEKAVDLVDMSITDMSDNVNKMGTRMEDIQNAYRGFSRQNFTMLDNLALGFAGTKEGMEGLLSKAKEISGIEYDISSYADIVQAIHVVQQEMGITGTTAAEAADTIQGSAGSVKAAWENLKIELGKDNGDIQSKFNILAESVTTTANNIVPRVKKILSGISEAITSISPLISEQLPQLVSAIAPDILSSATSLFNALTVGVVNLLPAMGDAINEALPMMWRQIKDVGATLYDSVILPSWKYITQKLPTNIVDALNTISPIVSKSIPKIFSNFSTKFLPDIISSVSIVFNAVVETMTQLMPVLGKAINSSLPAVWAQMKDVGTTLYNNIVVPAWNFVTQKLPSLIGNGISKIDFANIGTKISNFIKEGMQGISTFVKELDWGQIAKSIGDMVMHIDWVGILKNLGSLLANIIAQVPDIIGGFYHSVVDGITDLLSGDVNVLGDQIADAFSNAKDSTKDMNDEILNARNRMDELKDTADDLSEKELTQVGRTQSLWKELQTLVDENGRVKDGYIDRVNYINNELKEATGTEIELVDGQIQKYDELKTKMDEVIQKKRVSILSDSYQDVYLQALEESHNAGSKNYEIQKNIRADNAELQKYYNQMRDAVVRAGSYNLGQLGLSAADIDKVKNASFDEFTRSLGITNNAIDVAANGLLDNESYNAAIKAMSDRAANQQNFNELMTGQEEYNRIIEFYEKAEAAIASGDYGLAQWYYQNITDVQNGTYEQMQDNATDTFSYIKSELDTAVEKYHASVMSEANDADEDLRGTIEGLVAYGQERGITGADLAKTGILDVLSEMDSFDTSAMEQFMAETGINLGDLLKNGIYSSLSGEVQSYLTQLLYETNDLIKPVVNEDGTIRFGGVNSLGDVREYVHPNARGGIFRKETHIFGEAGDEAVVPLANDELGIRQIADAITRNMGSTGTIINVNLDGANISSDYDVDRLTDRVIEKISEGMEALKIRESRGYGGVFA